MQALERCRQCQGHWTSVWVPPKRRRSASNRKATKTPKDKKEKKEKNREKASAEPDTPQPKLAYIEEWWKTQEKSQDRDNFFQFHPNQRWHHHRLWPLRRSRLSL